MNSDRLRPAVCSLSSSLTRILAVVRLTLRDAVRSRVVVSLLGALLLLLVGLPLLVQGDGTPAGQLRILLEYALAAVVALLSAATLWAGCASMAVELQDRRLFIVLSKPIRRGEIWLGKWLGIVLLDAAALLAAGLIVIAIVAGTRSANPNAPGVAALLAARHTVLPQFPAIGPRTTQEPITVNPGESLDILFPLPGVGVLPGGKGVVPAKLGVGRWLLGVGHSSAASPWRPEGSMELRVRLGASRPEHVAIESRWTIGPPEAPVTVLGFTNYPALPVTLSIPAAACGPDGVHVRFTNLQGRDPATVMLDPRGGGLELLVPAGGFFPNLLRGLGVVLARLAFLAALGVTAGCLLSLPVAVFVAVFVLVLLSSAGYVESVAVTGVFYIPHEGGMPVQGPLDKLVLQSFRLLNTVTHPLLTLDPVPLLSDGRRVPVSMVMRAAGILGGAYVGATALFGIWRFSRREVGLSGAE